MAHPTETSSCRCAEDHDTAAAAFLSLRYHFGMLLGVTDFETEQAYHRGKIRLHNQWLHGAGVVWGYHVEADLARGELRVRPGLALDAVGRELHLEADACLNVAAWFDAHREELGLDRPAPGQSVTFDAHVVIRFKTCLTRQVPALAEPCENAGTTTAYSRVFETVEILLRPGLPPAPPPPPYHRLRLLFGLDAPRVDENGDVLEADLEVLGAPRNLASLRRFAALDEIELRPPEATEFPVLLATIGGLTLANTDGQLGLGAAAVDVTVRPTLVATAALQELLAGASALAGGPTVVPGSVEIDTATGEVRFQAQSPLAAASVTATQFSLAFFDAATGWHTATPNAASLDADQRTVTVTFTLPATTGQMARFVAPGTGPAPLLGVNLLPLNHGQDFVHQQGI